MEKCMSCGALIHLQDNMRELIITKRMCTSCRNKISKKTEVRNNKTILESIKAPLLIMEPDPRQVYTANQNAVKLFGKELVRIEGRRGGEVFDCVHAFTEAGCGKDIHCENCKIKNAVVATLTTGKSFNQVSASLDIKKQGSITAYDVTVSTEKVGVFALLRIDRYQQQV